MVEINVESWEDCKIQFKKYAQYQAELHKESDSYVSPLLYRGQADAKWELVTTLERYVGSDFQILDYYSRIRSVKPQLEVFTDLAWEIPDNYQERIENAEFLSGADLPAYNYLIYLRHFGFPSPLLDWSLSPFIGAFFAFQNPPECAQKVAIYCYMEHTGKGKYLVGQAPPTISTLKSLMKTHRRHFLQQSEYTICTMNKSGKYFVPHQRAFSECGIEHRTEHDRLWKITVPVTERIPALCELDSMNINAFSLFGSEESLMSTVALREFHLKDRYKPSIARK